MKQYGTLEDLKYSLRIDGTADDALLTRCLTAAELYVQNAIDSKFDSGFLDNDANLTELYKSAVYALASSYYTYRMSETTVSATAVSFACSAIIAQLRGLYDVYIEGVADEKN